VAGTPAQGVTTPQNQAGAAGLHEARHRYGLGVEKLREERATAGVHDKTVPSTVWVGLHFEGVAIRKFVGWHAVDPIMAANDGQGWLVDAGIGSDFSSGARVNTCMGRHRD
jgi:hypothetical protein